MPWKRRVMFVDGDDTQGHSAGEAGREVEIERMKLETADGEQITLEPDGEGEGEGWRVSEGPDDLLGHKYHR